MRCDRQPVGEDFTSDGLLDPHVRVDLKDPLAVQLVLVVDGDLVPARGPVGPAAVSGKHNDLRLAGQEELFGLRDQRRRVAFVDRAVDERSRG